VVTPTEYFHAKFLAMLGGHKLARYGDGGPSDRNRAAKRVKGKAQRQARKRQRGQ
jgi:hypothetical protein